jgi:hypothetical protein
LEGKYRQFLVPQVFDSVCSGVPLSLSILSPITDASDSDEEEETTADVFSLFEKKRKATLSKFDRESSPVLAVALKFDRLKSLADPIYVENHNCLVSSADAGAHGAPAERSPPQAKLPTDDVGARRQGPIPGQQMPPAVSDMEFVINDSWIASLSMELEEDQFASSFLSNLPDGPSSSKGRRSNTKQSRERLPSIDADLRDEDPVEEARKAALSRQAAADSEEEQARMKPLSAEEYADDWGFAPDLGEMIERVMKRK